MSDSRPHAKNAICKVEGLTDGAAPQDKPHPYPDMRARYALYHGYLLYMPAAAMKQLIVSKI